MENLKCQPGGGVQSSEALSKITILQNEVNNAKTKISSIETQLNNLKNSKATTSAYGLSKISTVDNVTATDSGLVLGAVEKNPSVSGSLMNLIEDIRVFLNSSYINLSSSTYPGLNIGIFRSGRIGYVNFVCLLEKEIPYNSDVIITVPKNWRPASYEAYFLVSFDYSNEAIFYLRQEDGTLRNNNRLSIPAGSWITCNGTYIIA